MYALVILNHQVDHYKRCVLLLSTNLAQEVAPIGIGIIRTQETLLASEICEELWTANSPHIQLYLSGINHTCRTTRIHNDFDRNGNSNMIEQGLR